jgi:hypothetical protein
VKIGTLEFVGINTVQHLDFVQEKGMKRGGAGGSGGSNGGKSDEKEKKGSEDKTPEGPEGGKGDGGKGDGSCGSGEVKEKGKKKFVIKEREGPQVSAGATKKALLFAMVCIAGYLVASGSLTKQKDIQAHLGAHGFVKQEDSDTFRGEEKVVLDNMRKSGKGLGAKSDDELKRSGMLEDYFLNPEGAGGGAFEKSPRKRGCNDLRAIEAIADWEVGFEANRQLIYISNTRYPHRGVVQLALGEEARMERRGFEFDRSQMRWVITMRNFLRAFEGVTADEVDEEVVREVLMASIDKGNEDKPDFNGGGGGGRD